jgi:ParB/RepB/Spo0J family partition protein
MPDLYQTNLITVNRETRQRRELKDIEQLAASITARGLINPITITREGVLIAGERRLTAIQSLGWNKIPVTYMEDLSEDELHLIELEENTQRLDMTWQEIVSSTTAYHAIQAKLNPEWSVSQTAEELNLDRHVVVDRMLVQTEIDKGNPLVLAADKFSIARGLARRQESRRQAAILENVVAIPSIEIPPAAPGEATPTPAPTPSPASHPGEAHMLNTDFHSWIDTTTEQPFNLIHCDFPYGINFGNSNRMASANVEAYSDTLEDYQNCVASLANAPIAASAHLIFWFSPIHFEWTKLALIRQGWIVNPFPFIWAKSDNSGIIPDANRGGRRTYETAFLASKGDRQIVRPVAMHWHGARGEAVHASVKPKGLYDHLLRMYVDENTRMLDPTCGSGNALRVAKDLGAESVLGLEKSEVFWRDAVRLWGD